MPRLKRSNCAGPGLRRRRSGRGFTYLDADGHRIGESEIVERIKELAIPPAWEEVWICPDANGHIQATGLDDAERRQYIYHEKWITSRANLKFANMVDFARALPKLRRAVGRDLDLEDTSKTCVSACAVRLIDLGSFRLGGEQYADENRTYGIATILRSHVRKEGKVGLRFDYSAKGSQNRSLLIEEEQVRRVSEPLLRRRSGPEDFLVFREGKQWRDLRSEAINQYIGDRSGGDFSAKDFRTWQGTVVAAVALAHDPVPASKSARERSIRRAIETVSEELGNTPAVARSSYIDPRVLDCFRDGETIPRSRSTQSSNGLSAAEKRVLSLLDRG